MIFVAEARGEVKRINKIIQHLNFRSRKSALNSFKNEYISFTYIYNSLITMLVAKSSDGGGWCQKGGRPIKTSTDKVRKDFEHRPVIYGLRQWKEN